MKARVWAQEATSWYLTHLDPCASHQSNCKAYLRGPVVAITLSILRPDEDQDEDKKKAPKGLQVNHENGGDGNHAELRETADWREYLAHETDTGTFEFNQKNEEAYDKLSRRSKARLEAFLSGVEVAAPPPSTRSKKDIEPSPASGESLGLVDGLAGFRKITSFNGAPPVLTRTISATNTNSSSVKQCPQMGEEEITTRLELYIRTLSRVQAQQQECVLAAEPIRALKARARSMVLALVETVGTVRQQAPVLTRLLTFLLKELLAVDVLGESSTKLVRKVVSKYEHQTSFASLAFLSSPDDSAGKLGPLVLEFLRYAQQNWQGLESDSELERMLSLSVPLQLRNVFKTMEFHSIGHLLDTCHEYKPALDHMELAPSTIKTDMKDKSAIRQALRDLQREVLSVNDKTLPPVTSRSELLSLLQQTLNNSSFRVTRRKRRAKVRQSAPATMVLSGSELTTSDGGMLSDSTADNNSDSNGSDQPVVEFPERTASFRNRPSFHLSTVDLLTRRLLLAASRTGTGGDAYFIVRDLFGDDDVEVVPAKRVSPLTTTMEITSSSTKTITIRVHGTFDVYPSAMVGDCEPLIQLHTTTTEVIYLQQQKTKDSKVEMVERETDRSGWRLLSIRPALYERIDEWNTPS